MHFKKNASLVWESKPLGDQTRLGVRRLGVNTVWGSEIIIIEFRGHFWRFFS